MMAQHYPYMRAFRSLHAIAAITKPQLPQLSCCNANLRGPICAPYNAFRTSAAISLEKGKDGGATNDSTGKKSQAAISNLDNAIVQEKEKQTRTPWHREGSNTHPVARRRSAGAMTKGKLLTTPSRLLKLIIPLTTLDKNSDRKDVEPLALLVHPQQPLSYLERLIQSELPSIKNEKGDERVPTVHFKAENSNRDETEPMAETPEEKEKRAKQDEHDAEEIQHEVQKEKTRNLKRKEDRIVSQGLGEGGVESYSGLGRESSKSDEARRFVRWSPSTEIGDFIRDAARGKEFLVEIESAAEEIPVAVPSFNDRTHYLRTRLRKTSGQIMKMAEVKRACDIGAHKGAQRVAVAGAGLLVGYWYVVYRLTFETELGWDTMEPVTYLVGLSTLICGYLWFLYHNREVSYRSALNLTISRRQTKLYQAKGFDLQRWESLVEEGNALRKEIKAVAREYDVDWDEKVDEKDEKVTEALKQFREEKKAEKDDKNEKNEDDDDD